MTPSVRAACAVVDPPRKPYVEDPSILSFFRDLVEPFGSTVDEELLRAAPNVFHRDLVDRLAADEEMRGRKPELIIVTHALPDVHPFTAVASHLNMLFGGEAKSFSISEQGLQAPFTALRVVASFQRSGQAAEALVAVLEQTTLPTRFPLVHDNPLIDSGVFLVLGTDGELRVDGVESADTPAATARRLSALAAGDPAGTLLVLGPWVSSDGIDPDLRLHRVDPGTYCTSVWLALANHWRAWQREYATVVLCDTEPRTGVSHLAVLRALDRSGT